MMTSRSGIAVKMALLLAMSACGMLTSSGLFWRVYTEIDPVPIELALQQEMLAAQLKPWAEMVVAGQNEDRPGLQSRVTAFDQTLATLHTGGDFMGRAVERAAGAVAIRLDEVAAVWAELRQRLLVLATRPSTDEAFGRATQGLERAVNDLQARAKAVTESLRLQNQAKQTRLFWTLVALGVFNLALLALAAWFTVRRIVNPIQRIEEAARRVRAGDLTTRVHLDGEDQLSSLARTFNDMTARVQSVVEALRRAETVARAGEELVGPDEATKPTAVDGGRVQPLELSGFVADDEARLAAAVDRLTQSVKDSVSRLRAQEHQLTEAERLAGIGSWKWDLSTDDVQWSQGLRAIFGVHERFRLSFQDFIGLVESGSRERVAQVIEDAVRTGEPYALECHVCRKDGESRLIRARGIAERDSSGSVARVLGVAQDITDEVATQKAQRVLSAALAAAADMVVITDPEGVIEYVNPAFERATGFSAAEVVGMTPRQWKSGVQDPLFYSDLWKTIKVGQVWQGELVNLRKDGSAFTEEMTITPVVEGGRIIHFVAVKRDITARKRDEQELVRLAQTDTLTGLFNRHQFTLFTERAFEILKRRGSTGAVLLFDLDGFKYVNDTYGHQVGDDVLVRVAEQLRTHLRKADSAARLGGDEFAYLVHDISPVNALRLASKLVQKVSEVTMMVGKDPIRVGCSAGVVVFPDAEMQAADVLALADVALYAAKDSGRGRAVLYSTLEGGLEKHSSMQRARNLITTALEESRLVIAAQPIQPLFEGLPPMYEVLARLVGPDGEEYPPAEFIHQAEVLDLIGQIDRHVLELAVKHWSTTTDGRMAKSLVTVNVSARTLTHEWANHVLNVLKRHQFPGQRMVLEVTETVALRRHAEAAEVMKHLAEHGVKWAMDDFGSGAASFRNLNSLPFQYLKLDGAYIRDLHRISDGGRLVAGLAQLAHEVGLKVVAEWVENEETAGYLRSIGVDYAQGFHFGFPQVLGSRHSVASPVRD